MYAADDVVADATAVVGVVSAAALIFVVLFIHPNDGYVER